MSTSANTDFQLPTRKTVCLDHGRSARAAAGAQAPGRTGLLPHGRRRSGWPDGHDEPRRLTCPFGGNPRRRSEDRTEPRRSCPTDRSRPPRPRRRLAVGSRADRLARPARRPQVGRPCRAESLPRSLVERPKGLYAAPTSGGTRNRRSRCTPLLPAAPADGRRRAARPQDGARASTRTAEPPPRAVEPGHHPVRSTARARAVSSAGGDGASADRPSCWPPGSHRARSCPAPV